MVRLDEDGACIWVLLDCDPHRSLHTFYGDGPDLMPAHSAQLQVMIQPAYEDGTYEFIVQNHGAETLWHIMFETYELLGPGSFGLDDTHMPKSLTTEEVATISCLEAGASFTFTRKKWGPLTKYRGHSTGTFRATYAQDANNIGRRGLNASFVVLGVVPSSLDLQVPLPSHDSLASQAGKAFAKLISKLRKN